ncbi:MAG: RNA polymerase sigma factor, partial [Planctomycetes bacterium]|nr:RNA polymerase sigma factor [Planctomycetota bacterium]
VQQRIRDTERARDLTQDTFLHAYEKRATLRDAGSFFAWLFTIAANKTIDALRRRQARPERPVEPALLLPVDDQRAAMEGSLERREEDARIGAALARLDDLYRTVVILRYWSGLTPAQIARLLAEPEGTIRNRIFRAHERLRVLLEQDSERPSRGAPAEANARRARRGEVPGAPAPAGPADLESA